MIKPGKYAVWETEGGFYKPFDIKETFLSGQIIGRIRSRSAWYGHAVYLRGSCLEEDIPHPGSDIDIVVIGVIDKNVVARDICSCLQEFGRPIEISFLRQMDVDRGLSVRLLLGTRSRLVAGEACHFGPVAADFQTMSDHYYRYCYFLLPNILRSRGLRKVNELKKLTRCFGILHFLKFGKFSRDIYTCVKWAESMNREVGMLLLHLWQRINLSESEVGDLDIAGIKDFLRSEFSAESQRPPPL